MPAIDILIRGKVQGVGFRFFVFETATSMGIAGEVWNRSDGAVEVIAEHADQKVLDAFVETLHTGPGRVDSIKANPAAATESKRFEIGPTR
jgi:acylphosphatase